MHSMSIAFGLLLEGAVNHFSWWGQDGFAFIIIKCVPTGALNPCCSKKSGSEKVCQMCAKRFQ